ncbi:MAG: hypothetical protein MO852_00410 [Candidatus Devosia euplotis]|nr:hypothetical protein [Candidatus Devosia euplotis]
MLEEVMLEQYYGQYGINGCYLRAPWVMEKDDFRYVPDFDDQFCGPDWDELLTPDQRTAYRQHNYVPLLIDTKGDTLKRNFIHVTDLVSAMLAALDNPASHQQLFNIAIDQPADYGLVAERLKQIRGLNSIRIKTPFHSN